MRMSRRRMLAASVTLGSAAAAAPLLPDQLAAATADQQPVAPAALTPPPLGVIALNRMGYGPRPGDLERFDQLGYNAYVDEQLNPSPNLNDDPVCKQRLEAARLLIRYTDSNGTRVDEQRPLRTVVENWSLAQLWSLRRSNFSEQERVLQEVRVATWIRALYSRWQLRELLVEFWHNHFNVDAFADGSNRILVTWPLYDALMRRNCLGNFKTFLEEVAKSVAMLYYLDNATSRDGPANENFARELFELHTLGADNYFNALYNRWRDVPGALEGNPVGYIDQDVYEAARAFTGWTVASGQTVGRNLTLPDTGEFWYYEAWHDNAQKRVLASEIDSNLPPLTDGMKVIELVAHHPGTARYICTKLCRRLVADDPSEALIQQAIAAWTANRDAPDQIAQTVRAILLADESRTRWGQKVKRPFELIVSFLRATAADYIPNTDLTRDLAGMGYLHFSWGPPTGHPDTAPYWLSTNVTLRRWNLIFDLLNGTRAAANFNLQAQIPPTATTVRQIVDFWIGRILAHPLDGPSYAQLLDFMRQNGDADAAPSGSASDVTTRIRILVGLIAATPEFQLR